MLQARRKILKAKLKLDAKIKINLKEKANTERWRAQTVRVRKHHSDKRVKDFLIFFFNCLRSTALCEMYRHLAMLLCLLWIWKLLYLTSQTLLWRNPDWNLSGGDINEKRSSLLVIRMMTTALLLLQLHHLLRLIQHLALNQACWLWGTQLWRGQRLYLRQTTENISYFS